LSNMLLVK